MRIEKDWITTAGFRAVVIMQDIGFRCGYVGIPRGHALHGVGYYDVEAADGEYLDVHGGLTFANGLPDYPTASDGLWWFGYDCGHYGDGVEPGSPMGVMKGPVRSLDYCEHQCESLATQLVTAIANVQGQQS